MINNIKEVLVQQEGKKNMSTDEESYNGKQMLHFEILGWVFIDKQNATDILNRKSRKLGQN